jgi:hypothetical protein
MANPYQCIERSDAAMAPHLDDYAQVLASTHNAGISQRLIDQAEMDGQNAARAFQMVGRAAPTKAGYTEAVNRTGIFSNVHGLEHSVNTLSNRLNQMGVSS